MSSILYSCYKSYSMLIVLLIVLSDTASFIIAQSLTVCNEAQAAMVASRQYCQEHDQVQTCSTKTVVE